ICRSSLLLHDRRTLNHGSLLVSLVVDTFLLLDSRAYHWFLPEACTQNVGKTLDNDLARHLRLPYTAIQEDNGRLHNGETQDPGTISHLNLESIPLRLNTIQIDTF